MGFVKDFFVGDPGRDPEAFRAPGFQEQGELLNRLFTEAAEQGPQFTPGQALAGQFQSNIGQPQFAPLSFQNAPAQLPFASGNQFVLPGGQQIPVQGQQPVNLNQLIPQFGQPGGTTQGLPGITPQFTQRNPFQFTASFDPNTAVGDAFTPALARAQAAIERAGTRQRDDIQEDLNRRGLLQSGALTENLQRQREAEQFALADTASRLAAEQARSRLGAQQFGSQFDLGSQRAQAEEIFRQQGATDTQAKALADIGLRGRSEQFRQNLAGRELALNERGMQEDLRRGRGQDLLNLFRLSARDQQGVAATPGFIQNQLEADAEMAREIGGTFAGGALGGICLPAGTQIELDGTATVSVEAIKVGDKVKGGEVIKVVAIDRAPDHKFSEHKFESGSVVMTHGHPYFDNLISFEEVENASPKTYDIKTTEGHYFVNGVKLGSTIGDE